MADLIKYLPLFVAEYKEIQQIMNTENPEFDLLESEKNTVKNNQFINTCCESGAARYEKMLGIVPFTSDTLEDRQLRILARFNENVPYTLKSLQNMLNVLCGSGGYKLILSADNYKITIKISLKVKKQAEIVSDILERILPCNLLYSVELLFNTWWLLKKHTWGALKKYSWKYIKEEVFK